MIRKKIPPLLGNNQNTNPAPQSPPLKSKNQTETYNPRADALKQYKYKLTQTKHNQTMTPEGVHLKILDIMTAKWKKIGRKTSYTYNSNDHSVIMDSYHKQLDTHSISKYHKLPKTKSIQTPLYTLSPEIHNRSLQNVSKQRLGQSVMKSKCSGLWNDQKRKKSTKAFCDKLQNILKQINCSIKGKKSFKVRHKKKRMNKKSIHENWDQQLLRMVVL